MFVYYFDKTRKSNNQDDIEFRADDHQDLATTQLAPAEESVALKRNSKSALFTTQLVIPRIRVKTQIIKGVKVRAAVLRNVK